MKYVIKIECGSWLDEYLHEEPKIETDDDIIELIRAGMDTGKVARLVVVARNEGTAPSDILPPNTVLYYAGARAEIAQKVAQRYREIKLSNGKTFEVREFIGRPGRRPDEDEDDDTVHADAEMEKSYVETFSDAGRERAIHYLLGVVPGHIFNRLSQLAANGNDVGGVAEQLQAKIDEMVKLLT